MKKDDEKGRGTKKTDMKSCGMKDMTVLIIQHYLDVQVICISF